MTWLTDLDPTLAAAVVSAVVSLVVVVFTTLLAPSVKYGFDRRLELRKLEFTYEAQQRKALRDHIGYHKGTILASADELASRIHRYQTARDAPNWLRGAPGDYFPRSFAFRIVNYWFALNGFAQDAIYIDAAAATRTDWAFAKAVKLNLDVWSAVSLFDRLGYDGNRASAHFFSGTVVDLAEALRDAGTDRPLSASRFDQLLATGARDFQHVFHYLGGVRRSRWELRYERLLASYLVIAATLNAFGYEHQKVPTERLREISGHCTPEVRTNLRRLIVDLHLEREKGFSELTRVLRTEYSMTTEDGVRMGDIVILSDNRRLAGRLFRPNPPKSGSTAALLFIHGLGSTQFGYGPRAEAASRTLGLTCLTFDLGGHGGSSGDRAQLSGKDHLSDVVAAYDRLRSAQGVDPHRIGVCGASYGGHLACLLIGSRPVKSLLLRAPDRPSEEALDNLRRFGGTTLVLESENDAVVPHGQIEEYLRTAANPTHHVIAGATHVLEREEWKAAFLREILTWFKSL
jgi:dienelactone hydrolase